MEENSVRNEISQLGKFSLIDRLTDKIKPVNESTIAGMNEDAAVADYQTHLSVTATRLFQENIDFDLTYFPLKHLGYKCASIVMTDVLAMNALPRQLSAVIAVSNRFSIEAVEELMTGLRACCHNYKTDLTFLDIRSSVTGLSVALTACGETENERLTRRTGAAENELICVSGDFGSAYTGLLILQREKKIFEATHNSQPDFEGYEYLLEKQLKPEPRLDIVEALRAQDIQPTAMTAVTEGIATSLFHLCMPATLGCTVYENKIPVDQLTFDTLRSMKIVATTVALNGGEDYELMFTIRQSDYEKVKKIENVSVIGYIGEKNGGRHLISNDNRQIELRAQGFGKNL